MLLSFQRPSHLFREGGSFPRAPPEPSPVPERTDEYSAGQRQCCRAGRLARHRIGRAQGGETPRLIGLPRNTSDDQEAETLRAGQHAPSGPGPHSDGHIVSHEFDPFAVLEFDRPATPQRDVHLLLALLAVVMPRMAVGIRRHVDRLNAKARQPKLGPDLAHRAAEDSFHLVKALGGVVGHGADATTACCPDGKRRRALGLSRGRSAPRTGPDRSLRGQGRIAQLTTCTVTVRLRGRSSKSSSTSCCQVPSESWPSRTGIVSEGPIRAARRWAWALVSWLRRLCW
jgi:hypothetical protein